MRFIEDYLKIEPTSLPPAPGRILISVPFFNDPFFYRSVVLLTDYEPDSTAGFILNKESDYSVREIVSDIKVDDAVYVGGPVMSSVVFGIHNHDNTKKSAKLLPGVYVGYDNMFLTLIETKAIETMKYKFFIGYSGWSPGQLDDEIERKLWVVGNPTPDLIFDTPADLIWEHAVRLLGKNYLHWLDIPFNAGDN